MRFVILLCALNALLPSSVRAHSWYPHECCSGFDCMPAESIYSDRIGKVVVVGKVRVRIPANFSPRVRFSAGAVLVSAAGVLKDR
jgi:hypothetical protein